MERTENEHCKKSRNDADQGADKDNTDTVDSDIFYPVILRKRDIRNRMAVRSIAVWSNDLLLGIRRVQHLVSDSNSTWPIGCDSNPAGMADRVCRRRDPVPEKSIDINRRKMIYSDCLK